MLILLSSSPDQKPLTAPGEFIIHSRKYFLIIIFKKKAIGYNFSDKNVQQGIVLLESILKILSEVEVERLLVFTDNTILSFFLCSQSKLHFVKLPKITVNEIFCRGNQ